MTRPLDPTQFTRESAERIANVVRAAELASPAARPLSFDRVDTPQKQRLFRVCTFTGAWSINDTKTVTFRNQTATPNTVAAVNLFFPFPAPASATDCAIAKDGTAWYLIDVPFETATAVFAGATASTAVMRDVTLSASLNTSNCTISIGKTLVTTSVTILSSTFTATFVRFKV
jgi:hypothetical protein